MAYSPEEIGNRDFSLSTPGYDRAEVDAFLRELAQQVSTARVGERAADERAMSAVERLERLADRFEGATVGRAAAGHPSAGSSSTNAANLSAVTPATPVPPVAAPPAVPAPAAAAAPAPAPRPVEAPTPAPTPTPASTPAPAQQPVTTASAPSDLTAPVVDESVPVAERLDRAKNLLDGVLDDVMGSLRPEN